MLQNSLQFLQCLLFFTPLSTLQEEFDFNFNFLDFRHCSCEKVEQTDDSASLSSLLQTISLFIIAFSVRIRLKPSQGLSLPHLQPWGRTPSDQRKHPSTSLTVIPRQFSVRQRWGTMIRAAHSLVDLTRVHRRM